MKGLLWKDLMNLKKYGKLYGGFIAFYFILCMILEDYSIFGGVVVILAAMLPVTSLAYDERAKWDKYALTMPISRRDIVGSKYLLGLLLALLALVINMIFLLTAGQEALGMAVLTALTIGSVGLFYLGLILPVMFRFGVEKGRSLMFLLLFLPAIVIVAVSKWQLFAGVSGEMWQSIGNLLLYMLPLLMILFVGGSFLLSVRIYRRKEF